MKIRIRYNIINAVVFLLLNLFHHQINGQEKNIFFEDLNYEQAIANAKIKQQPIFIFGYAGWCHFCEEMRDSTLINEEVIKFYHKNFICIQLDLEKEGKLNLKQHQTKKYPTLIYLNKNGELNHRVAGIKKQKEFIDIGTVALDSLKNLKYYSNKYQEGKLNSEQCYSYFQMVDLAGMDNQGLVNNYLNNISDQRLVDQYSWKIINDLFRDIEQPCMKRLLQKKEQLDKRYTKSEVDNKFLTLYYTALMFKVQQLDSNGYSNITTKLKQSGLEIKDKIIAYSQLGKLKLESDWLHYKIKGVEFIDTFCKDDYRRLNEVAYTFFERVPDKDLMIKAIEWSRLSISLKDEYKSNYTLASLLHKINRDTEARAVLNHAIELAKQQQIDYKRSQLLLDDLLD